MPVEIYYYLIIPVFCTVWPSPGKENNRLKSILLLALVVIAYIGSFHNVFMLTDFSDKYNNISLNMKLSFFVFFSGSVLAALYHTLEVSGLLEHEHHRFFIFGEIGENLKMEIT